jgi:hypothetical protein
MLGVGSLQKVDIITFLFHLLPTFPTVFDLLSLTAIIGSGVSALLTLIAVAARIILWAYSSLILQITSIDKKSLPLFGFNKNNSMTKDYKLCCNLCSGDFKIRSSIRYIPSIMPCWHIIDFLDHIFGDDFSRNTRCSLWNCTTLKRHPGFRIVHAAKNRKLETGIVTIPL